MKLRARFAAGSVERPAKVRSGKEMTLWHCTACDFDFFLTIRRSLAANKLDESRLKAAGPRIPAVERDFANGDGQSRAYAAEYLDAADAGGSTLEVGCSWGYFLSWPADPVRSRTAWRSTRCARRTSRASVFPATPSLEACEARDCVPQDISLLRARVPAGPGRLPAAARDLLEPGGALVLSRRIARRAQGLSGAMKPLDASSTTSTQSTT